MVNILFHKQKGVRMNDQGITPNSTVNLKLSAFITVLIFIIIQTSAVTAFVVLERQRNDYQDTKIQDKVDYTIYRRERLLDSLSIMQAVKLSERNGKKLDVILHKLGIDDIEYDDH